uniref:Uncharacterized protein n=1 Tax=Cyclophora tenuis TaxID=216820 RepID=A0A7S1GRI5_CYCTE
MMGSLLRNTIHHALSRLFRRPSRPRAPPGMNISYVLDSVLNQGGLRPLDTESFQENDAVQPLRVVSSCVWTNGTLDTKCFGTDDYDSVVSKTGRQGLFACMEASMTVPGATGPPVYIHNPHDPSASEDGCFFDAFCFEPLPYRSAVQEGATHVLVFQTRPAGYKAKTQPGVYEKGVAPVYFNSHQQPTVANFFRNGGQQYRYLEDYLTMEEGQQSPREPIAIPPTQLQYGLPNQPVSHTDVKKWRKAHLMPIAVPHGTPELPTLEQDPQKVLEAVRQGFAAAYDLLAPAMDLDDDIKTVSGSRAAELVFPSPDDTNTPQQLRNDATTLLQHLPGMRHAGMTPLVHALHSATQNV